MTGNGEPTNYLIPHVIDRSERGERFYDIFSLLLKERIIMINDQIEAGMAGVVNAQLLYLNSIDGHKPIQMIINSPGGGISSGLSIIDTMRYVTAPIHTLCSGTCASMAAIMLAAGDRRFILPNGEVMIHQPLGGAYGQASDIEIRANHILATKAKMNRMLADMTGQDVERIKQDVERDYWMTAKEALAYGIVDEIIEPSKKSSE